MARKLMVPAPTGLVKEARIMTTTSVRRAPTTVAVGAHEIPIPCPSSYRGCLLTGPGGDHGLLAGSAPAGSIDGILWICWRERGEEVARWNLRFRRLCATIDGRGTDERAEVAR